MWMEGMEAEASGNLEAALERFMASLQGLGSAGEDAVPHVHSKCCLVRRLSAGRSC